MLWDALLIGEYTYCQATSQQILKELCAHYVGNILYQHQKNKRTVRTQHSCTLGAKVLKTTQVQCPHHMAKAPNSQR